MLAVAADWNAGEHRPTPPSPYSRIAQTRASLLMLPIESLHQAFKSYPLPRMKLLEELAREVSRAYRACRASKMMRTRRTISSLIKLPSDCMREISDGAFLDELSPDLYVS